jgi:hypothetical protein
MLGMQTLLRIMDIFMHVIYCIYILLSFPGLQSEWHLFQAKDAGTYTVSISNEFGSDSAPATLMVTDNQEMVEEWQKTLKMT